MTRATCTGLDALFKIRNVVNDSEYPLSVQDIVDITDIKLRTVQRYATRLTSERLLDFRARRGRMGYEYAKLGYWNDIR